MTQSSRRTLLLTLLGWLAAGICFMFMIAEIVICVLAAGEGIDLSDPLGFLSAQFGKSQLGLIGYNALLVSFVLAIIFAGKEDNAALRQFLSSIDIVMFCLTFLGLLLNLLAAVNAFGKSSFIDAIEYLAFSLIMLLLGPLCVGWVNHGRGEGEHRYPALARLLIPVITLIGFGVLNFFTLELASTGHVGGWERGDFLDFAAMLLAYYLLEMFLVIFLRGHYPRWCKTLAAIVLAAVIIGVIVLSINGDFNNTPEFVVAILALNLLLPLLVGLTGQIQFLRILSVYSLAEVVAEKRQQAYGVKPRLSLLDFIPLVSVILLSVPWELRSDILTIIVMLIDVALVSFYFAYFWLKARAAQAQQNQDTPPTSRRPRRSSRRRA